MPIFPAPHARAFENMDPALRVDLERALARLAGDDPVAAEILVRRVVVGQTSTEIAAAIDCFPETVRVVTDHCLRSLRRSLFEWNGLT